MKIGSRRKNSKGAIITVGHKLLRTVSEEVRNIDREVREITRLMEAALKKHLGVGLAAVQIGIPKRIILIDLTQNAGEEGVIRPVKTFLINPVIRGFSEREEVDVEGCLSVPDVREKVKRRFWVELEGYTEDGNPFRKKLYDLAARVAQHEIDHTNGVLFIDKIEKC